MLNSNLNISGPMKNVTLLIALIISLSSFGQNHIENGNFERELQNWNNLQGENESYAQYTVETRNTHKGYAMKVNVLRLGANDWDIQSVVPVKIKLKKKKLYRLSFYGRTRTPGAAIRAVIQNQEYSAKDFTLTTSWNKYTWEFKTTEEILDFKLHFFNKGTFYVDEVYLERVK